MNVLVRQSLLNLVTASATVLLLGVLATVAVGAARNNVPGAQTTSLESHPTLVGVAADPWRVSAWENALGRKLDIAMMFRAWDRGSDPSSAFAEAARRGLIPMVTWEPWRPVPDARNPLEQGKRQPRYSNRSIAAGRADQYVRMYARAAARHPGPILLRYAHEMNGFWYPWHHDPGAYVRAWRRVHRIMRSEGADNVVFVWSVNPDLYDRSHERWAARIMRYWPGGAYVDWVGSTMINFGGFKGYDVPRFASRIDRLRSYKKPMMITEFNTHYAARVEWLRDFGKWLARRPWVRAVVWSQLPSRAGQQIPGLGNMDWNALEDRASARLLARIVDVAHRDRDIGRRGEISSRRQP